MSFLKRSKSISYLATIGVLTAGLTACGGDEVALENGGGSQSEGLVTIDGSSTVFPITEAVAEEFQAATPGVRVTVGVSGTGGGFSKFCAGETDISNASRPIKESEIQACEEAGIEYIEIPIAQDGLSVVVNPENDWASCLTVDELKRLWEPDAQGTITNWNQIRPEFPDQPITLYGPGTDSGTFDYFTDAIVGEESASRGDYTASEDDNVIVQGVSSDPNAIGYFGLAYLEENRDRLKVVAIDNEDPSDGEGCIEPTTATVEDGTYQPLSRPEFIYVKAEAAERPEVQDFVKFYLDPANAQELVTEVGYIPLNADLYNQLITRFENRVTGTVFEGGSTLGVNLKQEYGK